MLSKAAVNKFGIGLVLWVQFPTYIPKLLLSFCFQDKSDILCYLVVVKQLYNPFEYEPLIFPVPCLCWVYVYERKHQVMMNLTNGLWYLQNVLVLWGPTFLQCKTLHCNLPFGLWSCGLSFMFHSLDLTCSQQRMRARLRPLGYFTGCGRSP